MSMTQKEARMAQLSEEMFGDSMFADLVDDEIYQTDQEIAMLREHIFATFMSPSGHRVLGWMISQYVLNEQFSESTKQNDFRAGARHLVLELFRILEDVRKEKGYGYSNRIDPIEIARAAEHALAGRTSASKDAPAGGEPEPGDPSE